MKLKNLAKAGDMANSSPWAKDPWQLRIGSDFDRNLEKLMKLKM